MNKYLLAGAAALALALPAAAQDTVVTSDGDVYVLSDPQQVIYDAWPPERQTVYLAWPMTYQEYYWTLTPEQQKGWWVLTDEQRAKVYAMTPAQRTAAWTAIAAQLSGSTTSATARTAATTASTVGPRFVSNEVVQTTPAAAPPPADGEYPVCKDESQDHCIQPRAAGLNWGNTPLNYWPGKPASEIPGKKPVDKPGG